MLHQISPGKVHEEISDYVITHLWFCLQFCWCQSQHQSVQRVMVEISPTGRSKCDSPACPGLQHSSKISSEFRPYSWFLCNSANVRNMFCSPNRPSARWLYLGSFIPNPNWCEAFNGATHQWNSPKKHSARHWPTQRGNKTQARKEIKERKKRNTHQRAFFLSNADPPQMPLLSSPARLERSHRVENKTKKKMCLSQIATKNALCCKLENTTIETKQLFCQCWWQVQPSWMCAKSSLLQKSWLGYELVHPPAPLISAARLPKVANSPPRNKRRKRNRTSLSCLWCGRHQHTIPMTTPYTTPASASSGPRNIVNTRFPLEKAIPAKEVRFGNWSRSTLSTRTKSSVESDDCVLHCIWKSTVGMWDHTQRLPLHIDTSRPYTSIAPFDWCRWTKAATLSPGVLSKKDQACNATIGSSKPWQLKPPAVSTALTQNNSEPADGQNIVHTGGGDHQGRDTLGDA